MRQIDMLPHMSLVLVVCLIGITISPVLARFRDAPNHAITLFSEPKYKGTKVLLELSEGIRDKCGRQ